MPGIIWEELDSTTMSRLGVDLIRDELARRELESTGSKEELIQRLEADIHQRREATPRSSVERASTAGNSGFTLETATLESLALLFQQLPRPSTTVTTLPDLSSSIAYFDQSPAQNVNVWLNDVRRVQQLAAWDDATTRLIAASKLKGTARNWHLAFGNHHSTWETWSAALKETFSSELTLIEWQERVIKIRQGPGESLQEYAYAKLRVVESCPVTLTDAQKIDYLLQGLQEPHVIAAIAANRPLTVRDFMSTCTSLDKCTQRAHDRASVKQPLLPQKPPPRSFQSGNSGRQQYNYQPPAPPTATTAQPRQRISELPKEQQERRYEAISAQYGAPAFRSGQDIAQATCYKCKELGHLASACPSRSNRAPPSTISDAQQARAFHSMPEKLEGSQHQCPFFTAAIAGVGEHEAYPDSGSNVTLISKAILPSAMILPWTNFPLAVVGGGTALPVGSALLKITIGPITGVVEAAVLDNNVLPLILGEDWFLAARARLIFQPPEPTQLQHPATGVTLLATQRLVPRMANAVILARSELFAPAEAASQDCLQREPLPSPEEPPWQVLVAKTVPLESSTATLQVCTTVPVTIHPELPPASLGSQLSPEQQTVIADILAKNNAVFSRHEDDIGHFTDTQHRIDLLPNTVPYSRSPYRYTLEDRQFLERQIKKLLAQNIILPASGPWAFPVVVVSRSGKKRLCVNYIPLNERTIKVVHPLPLVDDIIQDIAGCAYFATMDIRCAYWQVSLRPQDYEKTAFITHHGTYMWTRMPFGLKNAPSTFQRAMQLVFQDLQPRPDKSGIRVYLDDILIYAESFATFADLMEEALQLLHTSGLKASLEKCSFGLASIKFLGFIISSEGHRPDPERAAAMYRIATPRNQKEVLSWIQTASFYRRFIKGFAKVVAPLQALVKSSTFLWSPECESAFQAIRSALTKPPLLAHFNQYAATTVTTDASGEAIGAVLSQFQDCKERVIAYASRSLTLDERKLHSNVWEGIAVHWAITVKFRQYLIGMKFVLVTDNWTVACLTKCVKPSRRFTSMLMDLVEFDFSVRHLPGRQNVVADHLSRLSCAVTHSAQALVTAQEKDPECSAILQSLANGDAPAEFNLIDNVLYHRTPSGTYAVVVPSSLRPAILQALHDGAGHFDVKRTLHKVQDRYWWPNMEKAVKSYVSSCQCCQQYNRPTSRSVGFLGKMPTSDVPFSSIAIDHITMPPSNSSWYILNVIDFATRFIAPGAVPSTSAREVKARIHGANFHDEVRAAENLPRRDAVCSSGCATWSEDRPAAAGESLRCYQCG
ncbi:uncharacterized protein [Dermacentor albipictus]|uniref:uncharacterized protein n=1 Tax=Dermacentor albipictus TaxID=60249 RepID=UPI0038FC16E8